MVETGHREWWIIPSLAFIEALRGIVKVQYSKSHVLYH
jgi:hypothetical protein